MESCLYEGVVRHERLTPVRHRFRYGLYLAYVDLAEVPSLVKSGVLSDRAFASASFLRRDHLGDPCRPLDACVREAVRQHSGMETDGPIRVLTQLRTLGCYFNPLTLYYCFASDGATLRSIVAMVQNTPWLERHAYVLWEGNREALDGADTFRHRKAFHVSPFMAMELDYRWRLDRPGEHLAVGIENLSEGGVIFRAGLEMQRRPLTVGTLRKMQFRHAFLPMRIVASIYYQAIQLWRKRCPFYSHPKHVQPFPSPPAFAKPGPASSSAVAEPASFGN